MTAPRKLFLIRHGQYKNTAEGAEPDGPLTAKGRQQAELTGQRLAKFPVKTIHYSPLERTTETADLIAQSFPNIPRQPSLLLRECIPSVPDPFKDHFAGIPEEVLDKRGHEQAKQAFATFFHPADGDKEQHELIIAHGNIISYFACRVLQAPLDSWININIQHCGICEVVIGSPLGMELHRHNDNGHLPAELQTWN